MISGGLIGLLMLGQQVGAKEEVEIVPQTGHTYWIFSVAFSPDGRYIVSKSLDGNICLQDVKAGGHLLSMIGFTDGEWISYTPRNYFNSSPNSGKHIAFRIGKKLYEFEQYAELYRQPEIVAKIVRGEDISALEAKIEKVTGVEISKVSIADIPPPEVVVQYLECGDIVLKPETRIVDCSPITIVAKAVERKNGVGRITIELNGKIVFEGSNLSQKEHQLKVPITLNEKENKLTLLAHSTKRVKSYPQEISLTYKEELLRGKSLPELAKHYFGKSRSWAVVIGINSYSGKGSFGKLKYAVNDAAAVRKYLINHLDFSKEQIISIYDQQATRERIETLLGDELPGKLKQEDRLLVFFAGHGETRKSRKGEDCGYLVPVDGDKQRLEGTCISMDDLSRWSELIPARQILFIVDACYSGIAGLVHRKSKITEETRKQV